MNSKNSKTFDPHRLKVKHIALSNLSIYYTWKDMKMHKRVINLKYQLQHGLKNLNYLMDYVLYPISNIQDYFEYILKKHGIKAWTVNPSIKYT